MFGWVAAAVSWVVCMFGEKGAIRRQADGVTLDVRQNKNCTINVSVTKTEEGMYKAEIISPKPIRISGVGQTETGSEVTLSRSQSTDTCKSTLCTPSEPNDEKRS